jgi:YidC/Oxa1 family membrane protein insertase
MMAWLMPLVFTFMMLFLPAALGIYMFTNSVLGITQQLVIEKVLSRSGPPGAGGGTAAREAQAKNDSNKRDQGAATAAALRKGKARV